jgi:hypothetical protein
VSRNNPKKGDPRGFLPIPFNQAFKNSEPILRKIKRYARWLFFGRGPVTLRFDDQIFSKPKKGQRKISRFLTIVQILLQSSRLT